MRMNRNWKISLFALAALAAGAAYAGLGKGAGPRHPKRVLTVAEAVGKATAKVDGTSAGYELEEEDGRLVWCVTVEGRDGKVWEVEVDDSSGSILEVEPSDEDED